MPLLSEKTKLSLAKKMLGNKGMKHVSQILDHSRVFRSRKESGRIPLFLFFYFYKVLMNSLIPYKKIVNINGYKMRLIPNDEGISRELLIFKSHEPLVTNCVKQEIKKGMTCIDIGCNIGYYALLESKLVGEKGSVIAFEPSPTNFKCFNDNIVLNNFTNIKAYNNAIGDENTKKKFLVASRSNSSRMIDVSSKDNTSSEYNEGSVITIPLVTLDNFVFEHSIPSIDFIRMDIEGYEYNAYMGMTNVINRFKPSLLIEFHPQYMGIEKTVEFLKKLKEDGYEIKYFTHRKVDQPWIADLKKHVEIIGINGLIEKLQKGIQKHGFHLYLINNVK